MRHPRRATRCRPRRADTGGRFHASRQRDPAAPPRSWSRTERSSAGFRAQWNSVRVRWAREAFLRTRATWRCSRGKSEDQVPRRVQAFRAERSRRARHAVTHLDYSAWVQTGAREENPAFHDMNSSFDARSLGVPGFGPGIHLRGRINGQRLDHGVQVDRPPERARRSASVSLPRDHRRMDAQLDRLLRPAQSMGQSWDLG